MLHCPEETCGAQRQRRRGGPGVMCPQQGGALLLCSNIRICRNGAGVSPGEQTCPCSTVLRRFVVRSVCTGGGTRACSVSGPGRAASQQGSALLLCPTAGSVGMVSTCALASGHAHALLSREDLWCSASLQAGGLRRVGSQQGGALLIGQLSVFVDMVLIIFLASRFPMHHHCKQSPVSQGQRKGRDLGAQGYLHSAVLLVRRL